MNLLQYLLKFSISLAVLFIFYRAVLRPLTFYQCNRFYLLCYSLLSFVIPFINITPWVPANSNHQLINIIPAISNYNIGTENQPADQISLLQRLSSTDWLLIVFCLGAMVMLVRLVVQYFSLRSIMHQSVLLDPNGNMQLYETSAVISPFSFGNAIYFNRRLHTEEELQRIIQHEFVHVKQKHTIDLLIGELLCIVNWFNPFAWFIRYSIRQNLEFIADNNVVVNGLDKKEYQYLLLKVVGVPQYSIASNFNFSNLKKRIAMMNKMKTPKLHLTKFLFVLPLLAVLFLAFRNNEKETTAKLFTAEFNKQVTDTIPAIPPPPPPEIVIGETQLTPNTAASINKKGYIITIADSDGDCIIVVRDKDKKIVKVAPLTEWNKDKINNENHYGEVPSLPPSPIKAIPVVPTAPVVTPQKVLTAAPVPPPAPVIEKTATVPPVALQTGNDTTPHPLVVVDGVIKQDRADGNSMNADEIKSLNVLEKKAAMDKYGYKGKNGVVEITTHKPGATTDSTKSRNFSPVKLMDATVSKKNPITEALVVIDGIESPLGTNPDNVVKAQYISSMNVLQGQSAAIKYGEKAKKGAIEIQTKSFVSSALLIIDGKEMPAGSMWEDFINLQSMKNVESMNVWRGKDATDKYGDKGKKGVIEIKTKAKKAVPELQ